MVQERGMAAQPRLHHPLRERHAHAVREALTQRSRGGLDAGRVAVLRMPGRARAPLAEALEILHGEIETEEMEERVEEHRGVARGVNEAVPVLPLRIGP